MIINSKVFWYLHIIEENELPSLQVSSDCNVHILHCGSLQPPSDILKCLDSPNSSRPIKAEEVEVHSIHLLFHLEVEAQVDVLQPGQQVLAFVHESPSRLHQPQLLVLLQVPPWIEFIIRTRACIASQISLNKR